MPKSVKMPRTIKKVIEGIRGHPDYSRLPSEDKFVFTAAAGGYCKRDRDTNKWLKELWAKLHDGAFAETPITKDVQTTVIGPAESQVVLVG